MPTTRPARTIAEILLLTFVSIPFVVIIYDTGSILPFILVIAILAGVGFDLLSDGEFGFGQLNPMMRIVVLLGAIGVLVSVFYLLSQPTTLIANALLGLAVGVIFGQLSRLATG